MVNDFIYDIETFPNVFTLAIEHAELPLRWSYEISDWRNDSREIVGFLHYLKESRSRMVGFNNLGFDYPVIHMLVTMGVSDANTLYQKAMAIINSQTDENRWAHQVYASDRIVEQIDLFKIHHFDNKARATSLKMLEFNMRADSIQDLPFKVGTALTRDQVEVLKKYNAHDVSQTKAFYHKSIDMIRFREELTARYQRDFMNHNDGKIGKDYFIMKLEEAGVTCYIQTPSGKKPRQTPRPSIALKDAILPWIEFDHPEFSRVLEWLKRQVITETKDVFHKVVARVSGIDFVFGLGGIHGSVKSTVVESDADYIIEDIDVESYYPSTAIAQRFKPEQYPDLFCDIYADLKSARVNFPKGTAENKMLKEGLNSVFGDSNSKFSVFYDPLMTMQITLNGQLLLCKLAENLLSVPQLQVIQANTDGLTLKYPRAHRALFNQIVKEWESLTKLKMESSEYKRMFIRDVNSYIAEYSNGKRKLKSAYSYNLGWHQNHSALVVAKVAEQVLVHGAPIYKTVREWPDIMDFMLRTKVPRSSYLSIEYPGQPSKLPQQLQNITRYYVAEGGGHLYKWMPPLKNKSDWRKIGVESGWGVQPCNDIRDAGKLPINFEYYAKEVENLCLSLI